MRTTIEMKPEHRSALLSLASRRGLKGLSQAVGLAIEGYLRSEADRDQRRLPFRALAGSLSKKEADALRRTTRQVRQS
jgi:hypothetical protein